MLSGRSLLYALHLLSILHFESAEGRMGRFSLIQPEELICKGLCAVFPNQISATESTCRMCALLHSIWIERTNYAQLDYDYSISGVLMHRNSESSASE